MAKNQVAPFFPDTVYNSNESCRQQVRHFPTIQSPDSPHVFTDCFHFLAIPYLASLQHLGSVGTQWVMAERLPERLVLGRTRKIHRNISLTSPQNFTGGQRYEVWH